LYTPPRHHAAREQGPVQAADDAILGEDEEEYGCADHQRHVQPDELVRDDERTHPSCWAHLLWDIQELTPQHPEDPVLTGWADGVEAIFHRARDETAGSPRQRWASRRQCQADLRQIGLPGQAVEVPHRRLRARILTYLASRFTFVTAPDVPPTTNAADWSLRHLVIARTISGGTRAPGRTRTRMRLASRFGTGRAQGRNPDDACLDLLASPQL